MSIRVGLIGCGRQAPKHISGLTACGDVDIVVADERPDRAAALAASCDVRAARTVDDIYSDPEVVAISICTPPASHGPLIRRAIGCGKHFICEKPLSADLSETRELCAAAERAGIIGMVGYIYRFAPAFVLANEVLAGVRGGAPSPVLGQITAARFRIGGPGSHDAWQHRAETEGGAINEMLVHMLDLALWYFGPPATAEILASGIREPRRWINGREIEADIEDWVIARLTTHGGADLLIEADLATPTFVQYAEIHGRNGSFMGSIQAEMPTFIHCVEEREGHGAGKTFHAFEPRNLFEPQMALFLDCISGKATLDRCTLGQSVELMEALERLRPGKGIEGVRIRPGVASC